MPTSTRAIAGEAGHDDVEDSDDTTDNRHENGSYAIHNSHYAVTNGAENAFDLFVVHQHVSVTNAVQVKNKYSDVRVGSNLHRKRRHPFCQ